MEQLWSHIYMCAKDKTMHWTQKPDQLDPEPLCNLLSTLHQSKIDWTEASLWPEDCIEGQWKRVVPMSFLVANIGSGWTGSSMVIDALCSGMLYPHPAISLVQGKDQQCRKTPARVGLGMMDHCVKEVQCLLSILTFLQRCCRGLSMTACEYAYNQPAMSKSDMRSTEELQEDLVLLKQFSAIAAAAHGMLVCLIPAVPLQSCGGWATRPL